MKKLFLSTILFLSLSNNAYALLPPFWEGVAELKAIFSDDKLKDYFDSADVIQSITKTPDGYLIITNRSQVNANVQYQPQDRPGPAKFQIVFQRKN